MRRRQDGIVLIDSLVGMLVFTVGILGMVALQAVATRQAGDARLRHAAGLAADDVIARMWVADPATLARQFNGADGSGGEAYMAWTRQLDCRAPDASPFCLPGVQSHPPSIGVDADLHTTVILQWASPDDDSPHRYVSIADLAR